MQLIRRRKGQQGTVIVNLRKRSGKPRCRFHKQASPLCNARYNFIKYRLVHTFIHLLLIMFFRKANTVSSLYP